MTWERLAPQARTLFYVQAALRWLLFWSPASLLTGGLGTWLDLGVYGWAIGAAVWVVTFIQALWLPWLAWERFEFCVVDDVLMVRHGVWFRRCAALPLSRIQHIDLGSGVMEQALGLARVAIYTAAGGGADAWIPGLAKPQAEALRDRILRRIRPSSTELTSDADSDGR